MRSTPLNEDGEENKESSEESSTAPSEGTTKVSSDVEAKDEDVVGIPSESQSAITLLDVRGKYKQVRLTARKAWQLTLSCLSVALGILSMCSAFMSACLTWLADMLLDLSTWVYDRLEDSQDKEQQ